MYVVVGTYTEPIRFGTGKTFFGKGEGIYSFRMDAATGRLTQLSVTEGVANPSYLEFGLDGTCLYCVNELKEYHGKPTGAVSAFAIEQEEGALRFLNSQESHGTDPCHIAVDQFHRLLLVSNFMSGSVCAFPIGSDGRLCECSDFRQHEGHSIDQIRQAGPHAHSATIDPGGNFVFVPDLGLDKLLAYRVHDGTGTLTLVDELSLATSPGAGPRQLAFHPNGQYAYLVNELNSTISAFSYKAQDGRMTLIETATTLPEDFVGDNTCAEVCISRCGRFVYASNRGHDSIVSYSVDQDSGRLKLIQHQPSLGATPRHFTIDPDGRFMLVANQGSDCVAVFSIDEEDGGLTPVAEVVEVPSPACVKVMPGGIAK